MLKKNWVIAVALAMLSGIAGAVATRSYEVLILRFMNGANAAFTARVNSSGQLVIADNSSVNGAVATFDDGDGSLLLRTRTSAQISALAPTAANELLLNSSFPGLCVSTGTTTGAWVFISSYTTATSNVKVPCY